MRSTFAIFLMTIVVIVTGLALYSALGIARNADDPAAGRVVTAFGSALNRDAGARACSLLTAEARSKLEDQRKKPCAEAIIEVASDLEPGGAVTRVDVAETSAFVRTSRGPAFFLDKVGPAWKLGAAGCEKQAGDAPYSCALGA
ncbi:MAG TPA: hypothetical protein VE570_11675 [Thermoleophilaceae bacterium]|nr:hypothetical protein [Thermoleophilaceae bacterium]